VRFDSEEVFLLNREQVARRYGKLPHELSAMPARDFDLALQLIWAENQK
jgi:hypothetical protein